MADEWDEGVKALKERDDYRRRIECWRGWPAGTVQALVALGLISAPLVRGSRLIAFPVQAPRRGGWVQAGFHGRRVPMNRNAYVRWEYRPKGIPGLPFVIGALHGARLILVTEGQWDLVTAFVSAGWLTVEKVVPAQVAGLAFRGATSWRMGLDAWSRFWPHGASIVIFPDKDEAGSRWWRGDAPLVHAFASRSRKVVVLPLSESDPAKDLNDLFRMRRFDMIEALVDAGVLDHEGRIL